MQLDVVYRPITWVLSVPPAAVLGGVLFWLGYVYLAPLPPVLAWLGHAAFFWARGDRPCRLEVSADRLVLDDPRRGQRISVGRDQVYAATLTLRGREDGGSTAILSLWDQERPLLALRASLPRTAPRLEEVDGDLISASIGGDGGTAYAFAPVGSVCRQLLRDPERRLVAWYRDLSPEVRERTPVRLWEGREPVLDLLGRHEENWNHVLFLDGEAIRIDSTPVAGSPFEVGHAERSATLLRVPDGSEGFDGTRIDLASVSVDGLQVVFPAGLAADLGDSVELCGSTLHTHNGEGVAGLYHLLRHTPRARWPSAMRDALLDGRAYLGGEPGEVA